MTATSTRTLKLTFAYDGGGFVGWQRQASGTSIQQLVEDALSRIEGSHVIVIGAGRTDAGVHALGHVASARLTHAIPLDALQKALNTELPTAVRVVGVELAPPGFHAQHQATAKTYRYCIWPGAIESPFLARYTWHVPYPLDVAAMEAASHVLEGRHDFAAFQAADTSVTRTVRTITRSSFLRDAEMPFLPRTEPVAPDRGPQGSGLQALLPSLSLMASSPRPLIYEVSGDGFLRHMVRIIVGSLVEVGRGRRGPESIERLLSSRDRKGAGPTAPAKGLWLMRVAYGNKVTGHRLASGI